VNDRQNLVTPPPAPTTTFIWATVTGVGPLRIQLDGDTASLPITPDSLIDPLSLAVADRTRVEISQNRVLVVGRSGGTVIPAGQVNMTARASAPTGWLLCDGTAVSRATYVGLFTAIGTAFGVGDGSTTFNVPNMRGRVPVGYDSAETEFNTLGKTGGEKTHTLTNGEIPALVDLGGFSVGVSNQSMSGGGIGVYQRSTTSAIGGGGSHNNLQPYVALNFIIKT
jgi:microcystin-dependent protein